MGRLWQTVILSRWQAVLGWLPVETVIRHRQQEYYAELARADAASDCSRADHRPLATHRGTVGREASGGGRLRYIGPKNGGRWEVL